MSPTAEVTVLLRAWGQGDQAALEQLTPLVYNELRKTRVIEMRFFGELSIEETAEVLAISPQSVMRDWKLAKAWLLRAMSQEGA